MLCWLVLQLLKLSVFCTCSAWCWVLATRYWDWLCWPGVIASEVICVVFYLKSIPTILELYIICISIFRLFLWHHLGQAGLSTYGHICLLWRDHFQYPSIMVTVWNISYYFTFHRYFLNWNVTRHGVWSGLRMSSAADTNSCWSAGIRNLHYFHIHGLQWGANNWYRADEKCYLLHRLNRRVHWHGFLQDLWVCLWSCHSSLCHWESSMWVERTEYSSSSFMWFSLLLHSSLSFMLLSFNTQGQS